MQQTARGLKHCYTSLQVASLGGLAVIVAQPAQGLGKITSDEAKKFAAVLAVYEQQGATMLIEFGHEMNGNWYAWGQQPSEYISAWQTLSNAIKKVQTLVQVIVCILNVRSNAMRRTQYVHLH